MDSNDSSSGDAGELQAFEPLVAMIRDMLAGRDRPLVVAIDGRSGVGKSTLSRAVSHHFNLTDSNSQVTVIEGDDFYAGGSAETWNSRTAAENAMRVIDWRQQRQVLEQVLREGIAEWHPFDWDSDMWDSDAVPLSDTTVSARSSALVILEGVYSSRPELHDLVDFKVLLVAPEDVRIRQLIEREGDDDQDGWIVRWSAAEDHYFANIMPPHCFDHIVRRA